MDRIIARSGKTYAQVVLDSIARGVRNVTLLVCYAHIIDREVMTHRVMSRFSESSRAIPVRVRVERVQESPFTPVFAKNKRGMQPGEELGETEQALARAIWQEFCEAACKAATGLDKLGAAKQWANRPLEPVSYHTRVLAGTEWDNHQGLRLHPDAQQEYQDLAGCIQEVLDKSRPMRLHPGEWHLPFVTREAPPGWVDPGVDPRFDIMAEGARLPIDQLVQVSTARCARLSYLGQDKDRPISEDLRLYADLKARGHMSAFEGPCQVEPGGRPLTFKDYDYTDPSGLRIVDRPRFIGNLRAPWVSHRKQIPGEDVFRGGEGA